MENFLETIKKLKSEYNTSEWIKICSFTIGGDIQEWFINGEVYDLAIFEEVAKETFKNNQEKAAVGSFETWYIVKLDDKVEILHSALAITEIKRK